MKYAVAVMLLVVGLAVAKERIETIKIVKADTIITIKADTVKTIKFDTITINKKFRDTSILVSEDTVKPVKTKPVPKK